MKPTTLPESGITNSGLETAVISVAGRRIGIVLQAWHMPSELTVHELVHRYPGCYLRPRGVAETIDRFGLSAKRKARAGCWAGKP